MIGESCDASSQGQALVFLSISWGIGTTIGPVIGGFLARPCEKYDGMALCGDGELFHARCAE
jgi:MFS family permease